MSDDNQDKQSQADDSINLDKLRGCLGRSLTIITIVILSIVASCHAQQPYTGPSSETGHKVAMVMVMLSMTGLVGTTLWARSKRGGKR